MEGSLAAFALAVAGGVLPTIPYVLVLWWCDRYEKEPLWLFTLAFLWGALPAVLISLFLELVLRLPAAQWGEVAYLIESSAVAPLVEEGIKGLALLAIFLLYRREFDGVLDGIIYGAVIGFGFAMTENTVYFLNHINRAGLGAVGGLWVVRTLVFGLNHSLFTATTGVGLGLARMSRRWSVRLLAPPAALALATVLHASHNLFSMLAQENCWSVLISLFSDWGGVSVLLVVMVLSWRQEQRWLLTQLRPEVDLGIISAEEYAVLGSSTQRLSRWWHALLRGGWRAAQAQRRRVAWATELALKKHQLATVGPTAGEVTAIDKLRERLRNA